jgi:two-component system CheB/CheR fusion protein
VSTPETDPSFEALLGYVRDNRGFDFTGYKRASLMRRVEKRMHEVGLSDYDEYHDFLEVHPEEFTHLFNTILINVTSFFRDQSSWEYLADHVVRTIVEENDGRQHIRVWSVGCASGEEAYSVAMLLAEAVGAERLLDRVKIYATDVDEEALAQARSGSFSAKAIETIPDDLREKYLEPSSNGEHSFKKDLRRAVIFGRHDLVKDAPISRVDLIVCRNTIMYFNSEVQSRIYAGFHFALKPGGFLFLGKSEMLLTRTSMFSPIDLKRRIFSRVPRPNDLEGARPVEGERHPSVSVDLFQSVVFQSATVAQIVLDGTGVLVAANGRARTEFGLGEPDLGRPFQDLELSYRPTELRSRIDRAETERRANLESAVPWRSGTGDDRYLDIEVVPLMVDGERLGTSITFSDVTESHALQAELERSRRELETAYEEIQSTVEELETTNEELQSTNEELETTNEELQSTNEELETMNEELQSTNEELETINTELHERTGQLNQANMFLESVLGGVRAGVIVLDQDFDVQSWNMQSEEMWGLRADDVLGKSIFGLDFGLPVDRLREDIRKVASGSGDVAEQIVEAMDRRGRSLTCKVLVSQMTDGAGARHGVILLVEPVTE